MNKANKKNTFSYHVSELRKRLIISVITILISGIITFIFHKDILEFLLNPPNGLTYFQTTKPIYTELTEYISVAIKVSIYVGILISSPVVFLQIILFLSPGLKKKRKNIFIFKHSYSICDIWVRFNFWVVRIISPGNKISNYVWLRYCNTLYKNRKLYKHTYFFAWLDGVNISDTINYVYIRKIKNN